MRFGFSLAGDREIVALLKALPDRIRDKVVKAAMGDVGKEVVTAARNFAPVRTGALRRSIRFVVRAPKARGKAGLPYVVVGADRRYYEAGTGKALKQRQDGAIRPAHYAHLVELGTAHSAAQPFLRPAFIAKQRDVKHILAVGFSAGVRKEIAKLKKPVRRRR